ncbi:RHH-type proline utilization regulon transcriptional repressor/proline dehydrogenase/delta 1-pyrroline-5-carboxylate dehydrogenase [Microbacterium sp. SORGH_AS 1204]|uniref:bifunctional proline dehydrogenase/L-glutamate gamma-semialdehyde dehydrogenase n=1 Tax=Microbacterium sp. SORGH_AS_1204 TaxID=3041785 RepID=UPI002791EDE2|nr:bifunctional proline dehydrogenase/L-glutamate gamma-semialdehyde dehydrogenase [Microbacterium sp. SORGH_AS_1204]MDQ1135891.1 RHH-type proline utilization regulon transcriptional repressor/proline dehydrogenase/delta 1-pyrroline-5-carboxylate dehydrogenase [Microbacterium sp. SORGH_AS_1204]
MSLTEQDITYSLVSPHELADEAIALVQRWLVESRDEPVDVSAQRLAGVLRDPHGLDFTVGFVDGVVRPEDLRVAARNLAALTPLIPGFLPLHLKAAIRLGAFAAPIVPQVVVPAARMALRSMVRHLIVDATDRKLGDAISSIRGRGDGIRLNVNLLGEAILGKKEAARRLEGTRKLLARDDVDYVSIKVSSTVAPHTPWAFDAAVADAVSALRPLYRVAKETGTFLNLDMEEFKDLDLTLAVFETLLGEPEFHGVEAGIVLQAYLPDALAAMIRLQEWTAARVASGGAPIKVRVVKGANLPMERVDADVHDWPLATWPSKQATDASYKAVLDYALRPEHTANVRIGVAGHNLFDIALAWLLAERRGVTAAGPAGRPGIEVEMLLGMATAQQTVVRRTVGSILLYTPVVHPQEFDVAIAYLIRRLEEGASSENFMSAVFDLDTHAALFARERDRFLASLADMPEGVPASNRVQDRTAPAAPAPAHGFRNTPDSDPAIEANRGWAAGIVARMQGSDLGRATIAAHTVTDDAALNALIQDAADAAAAWRALGAAGRAEILHRAGDVLEARRADLLEVMGAECGKVIEQSDPEVSEAIDFAHYYAEQARTLDTVDGAHFTPVGVTVVTPPWNFPVAIPAGSTLAALAAGSAVVIKPAGLAERCGAVMVEALWEAGVPREVLKLVQVSENDLGRQLLTHPAVERVVLTGAYETAELFRSFRPDLPLLAETSGKNAVIVTPSADLDLAAKDVAMSAFGHAGQKCSAASLVVLVGSVARSRRFRDQLVDAVTSLEVGMPWDEASRVGPLIEPAQGKLLRALTSLEPGQRWVVEPQRLDADGMLWRPGIREGVQPGSEFHRTEYFGPVLGIMTAETLEEAIEIVNAIEYGLTSGLHALDTSEIDTWLARIEAGNVYVNRGTTGAIVQRQPFGGWKKSAVGAGTKAGGPHYLFGFGTWTDASSSAPCAGDALAAPALAAVPAADREWLASALASDAAAWASEFSLARDVTGLESEQNVLRYAAVPVTVRLEDASSSALVRVVAPGVRAGSAVTVSCATELSPAVRAWLEGVGVRASIEDASDWGRRAARLARTGGRVRLLGGSARVVAEQTGGSPSVAVYAGEVTRAGRVELLPFLREQAVSITAHRFGTQRRYEVPPLVAAR